MSNPWNDVASVRALLATAREAELRSGFDPSSEAHAATLLALTESERVGLLGRRERPAYMGGAFHRAVTQLSFEWMRTRSRDALVLFDTLLQVDNPDRSTYCNALWAVQDDNTHLGEDPARARRYLAACLPHGPENPAIFYNAACVAVELGDIEDALGFVRDAVRYGYDGRETMRAAFHTEPLFARIRDDRRFFLALDDTGPQGAALVALVIDRVKAQGWSVLDVSRDGSWPAHDRDFRPLSPEVLDTLTLPDGAPLPPSLRAWLAFDAMWLASLGWFELAPAFRWTPRTLRAIVADEFGGGPDEEPDEEPNEEPDEEPDWASYFDVPALAHGFLLPGGSESRRIWMLSPAPDTTGDHPLLYIDIDDIPSMGAMYPGFDVWLGVEAGVIATSGATYTSAFEDFRFASRLRHHARTICAGAEYVLVPADELGAPRPDDGITVSLARDDWFERLLALRKEHLPDQDAPITGASADELAALARHLGAPLPPLVARFLARVNGLSWGHFRFLGVAEMLDADTQRGLFGETPPPSTPFAVLAAVPEGPERLVLVAEDGVVDTCRFADGELHLVSPRAAIEGAIEIVRHAALFAGATDDFLDEDTPDEDE